MENSKVEWTTHTFNPWHGCTKVSPGCKNCYADTLSGRNPKTLGVWGPKGTRVVAAEAVWKEPVKWDRQADKALRYWHERPYTPKPERPRVFCASLADVFEDWDGVLTRPGGTKADHSGAWQLIGNPWYDPLTLSAARDRLGQLIKATPRLDWLLLTKRPENARHMMEDHMFGIFDDYSLAIPPNVWLGTSVENQEYADRRIPELLKVPAAVRFLSVEPLLGPVDLLSYQPFKAEAAFGCFKSMLGPLNGINWVIVGGESGRGARPCQVEWVRSIVQQCKAAGVPCFVKQLGAAPFDSSCAGEPFDGSCGHAKGVADDLHYLRLRDKKGGDVAEWPKDLRVREFPVVRS